MINKNDILKMARGVFDRSQGYRERSITNPVREWFVGIGLLAAVVVVGSALNWSEYIKYNTLGQNTEHSNVVVEKYGYVLAERARTLYIARKTEFQALQNKSGTVSDPVIPTEQDSIVATSSSEVGGEEQEEIVEPEVVSEKEATKNEATEEVGVEMDGQEEPSEDRGPELIN